MKKKTTKAVPIKTEPKKKTSRRLTNKERDAVCAALIDYLMVVSIPKEQQALLTSAIDKIRVLK